MNIKPIVRELGDTDCIPERGEGMQYQRGPDGEGVDVEEERGWEGDGGEELAVGAECEVFEAEVGEGGDGGYGGGGGRGGGDEGWDWLDGD